MHAGDGAAWILVTREKLLFFILTKTAKPLCIWQDCHVLFILGRTEEQANTPNQTYTSQGRVAWHGVSNITDEPVLTWVKSTHHTLAEKAPYSSAGASNNHFL